MLGIVFKVIEIIANSITRLWCGQMKKRGVFICIEGLDASGKTTQSKLLVKTLQEKGFKAVYTTEPSYGKIGRLIRTHVLLGKSR